MNASVIIINYNTFTLTCNCIQSVINKTSGIDYEIILVDNASSECDPAIFLEIFPKIKLIRNSENIGFSKGCNVGIQQAKGDIILLLNSDTVLLNNALSISTQYLFNQNDVGVVTCRVENQDGTAQNNCQRFPGIGVRLVEALRIHKFFSARFRGNFLLGSYFSYDKISSPDWVWGTFFLFPKRMLNDFPDKKLSETFWMYLEDMEWCWLAKKAGYKIAFVPEGRILHLGCGKDFSTIKSNVIKDNYFVFLDKYYSKFISRMIKLLNNI